MKNNKVVYTVITGDYDDLINHHFVNPDWDYIFFTDNKKLLNKKNLLWDIRPLVFTKLDNIRNQRWHKLHPHVLFPDYEESLYIDGNIDILNKNIFLDIEKIKEQKHVFSSGIHFERKNLYNEFDACIIQGKDEKDIIEEQRKLIEKTGFSGEFGYFFENNIIFRIHHNKKVIKIMDEWWQWIEKYSRRDQLSLVYVLWKNNFIVKPLSDKTYRQNNGIRLISGSNHITTSQLLTQKIIKQNRRRRRKDEIEKIRNSSKFWMLNLFYFYLKILIINLTSIINRIYFVFKRDGLIILIKKIIKKII